MNAYELRTFNGLKFVTFPLFSATGTVKHGFSTRMGGISSVPYDSLNLGLHVGDNYKHVVANRARAAKALRITPGRMVAGSQVHGDKVHIVTESHLGYGAKSDTDALPGVDALVTDRPGIPLASFYADCVPVFILDPVRKVAALAHAGWKGTVLRIAEKTVAVMAATFNCNPRDCLAAIGPCIGQCCYEVDAKVINELKKAFNDWQGFTENNGKERWKLNLGAANKAVLLDAGLKPVNVINANLCTACYENLFFSYRAAGGTTGRMGAMMELI
ncbi:MAG: peptidoglycan editing factor PgeF [Firmicutes bacterium]|nr:peptidoglycan editing factor PgeF [Bacillota bacterium]